MTQASIARDDVTFGQEPGHAELGCDLIDRLWRQDRERIEELKAEIARQREDIFTLGGRAMRAEGTVAALEGEASVTNEVLGDTLAKLDEYELHEITMTALAGVMEEAVRAAYRVNSGRTRGPVPASWSQFVDQQVSKDGDTDIRERLRERVNEVVMVTLAEAYSRYVSLDHEETGTTP